jgi:hypothetical protein
LFTEVFYTYSGSHRRYQVSSFRYQDCFASERLKPPINALALHACS